MTNLPELVEATRNRVFCSIAWNATQAKMSKPHMCACVQEKKLQWQKLKRLNVHPKNIIKTNKLFEDHFFQTLKTYLKVPKTNKRWKKQNLPTPWFQAARFQVEDLHQDVPSYWKTKHQVLGTRLLSQSWPASRFVWWSWWRFDIGLFDQDLFDDQDSYFQSIFRWSVIVFVVLMSLKPSMFCL